MKRRHLLTVAATIGGAGLFAVAVRQAGVEDILQGIERVGWGLGVILLLAGLRFVIRAECWRLCMPPSTRLSRLRAFGAFLSGDALGNVTPLGLLASEPAKVFLTRHHLATRESVASLVAENVIYAASVVAMVSVGLVILMTSVPLPSVWRWGLTMVVLASIAAAIVARRLLRRGWDAAQPSRFWGVFALDLTFHALAVVEVFLTLQWLLGDRSPTIAQAIVFEALNRVVTVAFKFVPFRIGVDEALTGAMAPLLAVNPAAGVALALVRKVRNLVWAGAGLAIIALHPVREETTSGRPGTAPAHRL